MNYELLRKLLKKLAVDAMEDQHPWELEKRLRDVDAVFEDENGVQENNSD